MTGRKLSITGLPCERGHARSEEDFNGFDSDENEADSAAKAIAAALEIPFNIPRRVKVMPSWSFDKSFAAS